VRGKEEKGREGVEEAERGWGGRGERVEGRRPRRRLKARGVGRRRRQRGKDEDENIHVPCLKNPQLCVCCIMLGTRGVHMYCNDSLIFYGSFFCASTLTFDLGCFLPSSSCVLVYMM